MYQYNYVTVKFKQGFSKAILEEHRDIIDAHAKDGWRFVSAIPTESVGHDYYSFDLVFEREQ